MKEKESAGGGKSSVKKEAPQSNGEMENTSRGNKLGENLGKVIGAESVANPIEG